MKHQHNINPQAALFWQVNGLGLIIAAVMLCILFPIGGALDHQIIMPWVNADGVFPYRENWWLTTIAHNAVKYVIIAIVVVMLYQFIASFYNKSYRGFRWATGYTLIAMLLSTSLVGLLKSHSTHACPWNLAQHGSNGVFWLEHTLKAGKCFPGGHSSAGFALIALFFAHRLQAPKRAWFYLLAAVTLGFAMGWAQMMRGAHFMSHNLWTLWVTWAVNVGLYAMCSVWFAWRAKQYLVVESIQNQVIALPSTNGNLTLTARPPK